MHEIAVEYVKAVLALGQHDADYVDAYYGPAQLRTEAEAEHPDLDTIAARMSALRDAVARQTDARDEMEELRRRYLEGQLAAGTARIRMLKGERLTFDEESRALYDAVAPTLPESHFERTLAELEKRMPGNGPLGSRYESFRRAFVVPRDKLDAVFQAAIAAGRERPLKHVSLPPAERFTVEYVNNKSWSGYNWYQGGYRSLIQINTDLPIHIDRAVDLACHEG